MSPTDWGTFMIRRSIEATVLRRAIATTALTTLATVASGTAHAQSVLPTGGTVTSGSATIASGPAAVKIDQSTARAIINWTSFDVDAGKRVVFRQPDATSATLNRVTGGTSSTIAGQIIANGAVYLVNPNGIAITSSGNVQTGGGFIASTLDIADGDFNAGRLAFAGSGTAGRVSNAGSITAGAGGYVALLGGQVSNSGTISVPLGKVALGAGEAMTLDLNGDGFLQVAVPAAIVTDGMALGDRVSLKVGAVHNAVRRLVNVSESLAADSVVGSDGAIVLVAAPETSAVAISMASDASISVAGTITASGGRVALTSTGSVSVAGKIDADSATGNGGRIVVIGEPVNVSGTLSARATGSVGDGGFIETSGATVKLIGSTVTTASANGTAGTWLIDPTDFTVAASGGDQTGAALTTALANNANVIIQSSGGASGTSGDININDVVNWSANTLTIDAYRNINVNAVLNATGTAGFIGLVGDTTQTSGVVGTGTAGGALLFALGPTGFFGTLNLASTGSFALNGTSYTIITTLGAANSSTGTDLQGIGGSQGGNYVLGNSIDASAIASFNPYSNFTGRFNGLGHVVTNMTINLPSGGNVGMFGQAASGSVISNVGLVNSTVTGGSNVGNLVAEANGTILNSFSTGTLNSNVNSAPYGGLVGRNNGTVRGSFSTVTVNASGDFVAGLVGSNNGIIANSYATGNVTGKTNVGGLAGNNNSGASILNSYATGTVTGSGSSIGGLVGLNSSASVTNAYATGAVSGGTVVGGLLGSNNGNISTVYATGAVSGSGGVGGLIGQNSSNVTNAYATGAVSASSGQVGGIVGNNNSTINNSYWDSFSTGQSSASGGGGSLNNVSAVTSDPGQSGAANYAYKTSAYGNFTQANWVFFDGQTRPFGAWEAPTSGSAIGNSHQLQLIGANATTLAASYILHNNVDLTETGRNLGTASTSAGMWSSAGFVPLGTNGTGSGWNGSSYVLLSAIAANAVHGFSGSFDGGGYTLSNLTIRRSTAKNVGLFGFTSGTLSNLTVGGSVVGLNGVGGLVGQLYSGGSVTNAISTASVSGNNLIGGLVGNATDGSSIARSSASGTISGAGDVGGLVGYASGASISRSFATGSATATNYAGGLVGYSYNSSVANSYALGNATATGATAGGLFGYQNGGSLLNSYAANQVASPGTKGGLIGQLTNGGTVTNSYWDTTVSGLATSAGGAGRTTAQLQDTVNYGTLYVGWDFATIWAPPTTGNYARLR